MIMSFDEVQDKLPSIVIVADGAPTKASKGGSQVGPVLLPVVPVGLRPGTQPEWTRPLEALGSIRSGRVTQSSQTQWSELEAQLLSWAVEDFATPEGSLEA